MIRRVLLPLAALLFMASGFAAAEPVPPQKAAYVGE
jgi:hypothetical protein